MFLIAFLDRIFSMQKKELQAREAKIAGVSRLKILQDRVDDLRTNGHLRSLLVGARPDLGSGS